jgi:hypothetical protein
MIVNKTSGETSLKEMEKFIFQKGVGVLLQSKAGQKLITQYLQIKGIKIEDLKS